MYKLLFDEKVVKDLRKIDKTQQSKILSVIKLKLIENPYVGKKLIGDLSPLYRYRVGNYRIIYDIVEKEVVVVVIKIKHRKDAYK